MIEQSQAPFIPKLIFIRRFCCPLRLSSTAFASEAVLLKLCNQETHQYYHRLKILLKGAKIWRKRKIWANVDVTQPNFYEDQERHWLSVYLIFGVSSREASRSWYLRMMDDCYLLGLFVENGSLSRLRGVQGKHPGIHRYIQPIRTICVFH